jgi:hypothetical protein
MLRGSKASVEGDDLLNLCALRHELNETRGDADELRTEVSHIKADVGVLTQKQGDVIVAVTNMHDVVGNISNQL